jgi:tripartite-type tricarboxylate transporter receptor subunit TctC
MTTMQSITKTLKGLIGAAVAAATLLAAPAQTTAEPVSFAGKQIKLWIGFSSVSYGYDTYGRMLARHLPKYLPGNPTIIVQNRPGAGSLRVANYIYNVAPKDGSEIALIGRGVAMDPLLGGAGSNSLFDPTKFVWLGSMNNEVSGFYLRQPGPAADLADVLSGKSLTVGATGAGGDQQIFTSTLNSLLGTKLKTIGGYPGANEILLAVARGELDGIVGYSWGVARSGHKDLLESGRLKIIMQLGLEKHRELANVPLVTEFVTKHDDRRVLELIFSRQSMGRPVVAPPGIDARVGEVLRKAFADAMHDPHFVAESERMGLEMNFLSGDAVQGMVENLYKSPHSVIARARAIAAANQP